MLDAPTSPRVTPENVNFADGPSEVDREPDLGFVGLGTHDLLYLVVRKLDAIATGKEMPAAAVIDLTPIASGITSGVQRTHVKLRCRWLVLSGGTAGHTLQIKSGTRPVVTVITNASPVALPLDEVFERGIDIGVFDTDGSSVNFAAYIIAYPE